MGVVKQNLAKLQRKAARCILLPVGSGVRCSLLDSCWILW